MKKYFVILSAAFLLVRCGSNEQPELRIASSAETKANVISFKVNGKLVTTSGWNISRLTWKNGEKEWLNITSNMHQDKRTIMANLDGAVAGTYSFAEGGGMKASHGDYKPDYTGDMMRSYSFISGSFVITEVDTVHNKINGSFSGRVKNNQGDILEITEGRLVNLDLRPTVLRY
jgi:hypothetical protein